MPVKSKVSTYLPTLGTYLLSYSQILRLIVVGPLDFTMYVLGINMMVLWRTSIMMTGGTFLRFSDVSDVSDVRDVRNYGQRFSRRELESDKRGQAWHKPVPSLTPAESDYFQSCSVLATVQSIYSV